MQLKELFADDNRGVSPVIGVILMVAITVILAAVIGTFVLGLGENVQQNASAGVSESSANDRAVTLNSLGPSTDGIKCSGAIDTDSDNVEEVGQVLECTEDNSSVVAYGSDVQDATVFTFEDDSDS